MKLSSPTVIFLVLGLLVASMTATSSRETPTHGVREQGGDGAAVQSEGVVFGLARASTFAPPAPNANHHPDPPFNRP
ncbi:hypothetical protein MUK42_34983 [Musa troglodytarum]|uniref:Uncharacterized protein n=1 Tax=Musa troglodytarum TaxID=320322 RepID=A0A9E7FLI9_9LILI|nr:hypothetical protein MUK42_34983 [Musa troglodytarum]